MDGWVEGTGMDVWLGGGDRTGWMDGGGRDGQIEKQSWQMDRESKNRWSDRWGINVRAERMRGRGVAVGGRRHRCLARQKGEAGIVRQGRGIKRWTLRKKKQG